MVGWGALEKALDKVGGHTNLIGKYWITSFNMIRLLFLFTIGASVICPLIRQFVHLKLIILIGLVRRCETGM